MFLYFLEGNGASFMKNAEITPRAPIEMVK
jgi:hypothetical protein